MIFVANNITNVSRIGEEAARMSLLCYGVSLWCSLCTQHNVGWAEGGLVGKRRHA